MKKLIQILTIVSLMLALVPVAAFAHTAGDPFTTDLIAGGGNEASAMDVGDVLVWNDGDDLYIKYVVTDTDWCITKTHLEVATSLENIPQTKKGNPIQGQFTYGGEHDCVAEVTYPITLSWDPDTALSIAAHAVVQTGGLDGLEASLPDQVTILVTHPGLGFGAPSYFDVTVSGGTMLDGMYDGYCVDTDSGVPGFCQANVYSSYEELASGLVEFPENLDLINYIVNQHYVGTPSPSGGIYTFGDVQRAIWELIEDGTCDGDCGTSPWTQAHVDEIVANALTNGEGFVPGCGDVLVVMLEPLWGQILIIDVPVPCVEAETAWGDGLDFPGKNWATYFGYSIQ